MKEIRYVYGAFTSREKAGDALENYYADGVVSACEMPRIEYKGAWIPEQPNAKRCRHGEHSKAYREHIHYPKCHGIP
jgi:hypothetical protein